MTGSSAKSSTLIFVLALICFGYFVTSSSAIAAPHAALKDRQHVNSMQTDPAVVNLQDYGAVGDGVADDGPALQAALDDLALLGGGTLQVPAGNYRLVTTVTRQFSSDTAVTIEGAPSATQIDVAGNGTGLDLTSEFIIAVGSDKDAITLGGIGSLLLKDVGFLGVQTVDTDAHIVLSLSQITKATVHHCEFYGLASLVFGGAILKADHTDLTLEETAFLGCAGNSGVSNSVVQNTAWIKVLVRDCKFIDYGTRSDFFSKTPLAPAYSWINIGDAADLLPSWSRREAVLDNIFMDEGVWLAVSARPDLVRANFPPYSVQMSHLNVNVNNLHSSGVYVHGAQRVLIDRSHFGWSHMAGAAIYLSSVGVAILDLIDTSDDATRLIVSAVRLSIINSVYTSLDSSGPVTQVITTDTPEEDPAQYVQQQYNNVLQHNADPAGYFYWTDKLLRCDADAQCITQVQGTLATFLAAAPPPEFSWTGHVLYKDGTPIAGANVSLTGFQSVSTKTDANGAFAFGRLATAGEYELTASSNPCAFEKVQLIRPTADQVTTITGTLVCFSISGRITTNTGNAVAGATLALSGTQTGMATSDSNGNYVFASLAAGGNYTVTPSKTNYQFTPQSANVNNLTTNLIFNFSGGLSPGTPVLVSGSDPTRALARDSVLKTIEPFALSYEYPWSSDQRTRITVYITNITLAPDDTVAQFSAEIEDASHQKYPLTVEYVAPIPEQPNIMRLVLRLNDGLTDLGDVLLRVGYKGVYSDPLIIAIGHVASLPNH